MGAQPVALLVIKFQQEVNSQPLMRGCEPSFSALMQTAGPPFAIASSP